MNDILSVINNISPVWLVPGSFLGGIAASLSPCSLGMLPLILAYVCGVDKSSKFKIFLRLLSFTAGLSFVLAVIGIVCALTGRVFAGFNSPYVILLFGSFLMIAGLQLIGILDFSIPAFVEKLPENNGTGLFLYPFIIGMFFSFLASPCSSPILAAIIGFAAVSKNPVTSFFMLFAFALGQSLPFVLGGIFASVLKSLRNMQKYSDKLVKFSGITLVIFALYLWYKVFSGFLNY